MDPKAQTESYMRWKSGYVNVMVAVTAFGMALRNKPNIRHNVRYGVSKSLCSWAHEFGHGGRNGAGATMQSMATLTMQRPGVGNMKGQIRHIENKYSVSSQDLGSL